MYDRTVSTNILCVERKEEYLLLFNTISDAEETLKQLEETLIAAQRQAEDLFLNTPADSCESD